ncbi:YlbF family regulator [Bacillus timonensis]|nr:YlbF family regulator [Bacillus timonensis]
MIATMERIELQIQSEELANMILQSDIVEEYHSSLYRLRRSKEAQQLIHHFVKMKDNYEEVQRFGKYHPDYKKVTKEIREIKRELDLNEYIAAFKLAEKNVQALLDEISVLVGRAVSENIKVPTGNPFFDSMSSCGGGCGSGGSCGCS